MYDQSLEAVSHPSADVGFSLLEPGAIKYFNHTTDSLSCSTINS